MQYKIKRQLVKSGSASIYVEIGYPKQTPAPAIIVTHGLRSYFPGFMDMFAKRLREEGYITVKFHFIGTGKSSGKFEEKTTTALLQNYTDVLSYVKTLPEVRGIGVIGRSNAGTLAAIHGPDPAVKAYVMLAAATYLSLVFGRFLKSAEVKGKFFYHKSYKRPHTKVQGRLPINFVTETKKYDSKILAGIKKLNPALYIQCTDDEAVLFSEKHMDYWKKHSPSPKKFIVIPGGSHSYKGHKRFVIEEGVKWFKRFLPIKIYEIKNKNNPI